jgi:hypothetical protein
MGDRINPGWDDSTALTSIDLPPKRLADLTLHLVMRLALAARRAGAAVHANLHIAGRRRPNPLNEIRRRAARHAHAQQDESYMATLAQDHGTHLVDQVSPE